MNSEKKSKQCCKDTVVNNNYVQVAGEESKIKGVTYTSVCCDEAFDSPHPSEAMFPLQCEAFRQTIEESYNIHLEKNQDYSPANILVTGQVGVLVRIWDKVCRILNLSGIPMPVVIPDIEALISKKTEKLDYYSNQATGFKEDTPDHDHICELYKEVSETIEELKKIRGKAEFDFSNFKEKSATVKDETLDDTWKDLATYSIIGNIVRKGKWGR